MMSLGAALYLAFMAYRCWFNYGLAAAIAGANAAQKVEVLRVTMPYPIAMTLLIVLCVTFAFAAVYALFFPTRSSN
jgi:hypothetical protein